MKKIQRALISVSDKHGIVEFAKTLFDLGVEILSTGGSARLLQQHGIPVIEVSDYTGFPEIMDGRVKTLHPKIHGGLLGRRDIDGEIMKKLDIAPIDMVVINLYPFKQTIENPNSSLADIIENIDIGGPSMLRSAAKNHKDVTVVCDPDDYKNLTATLLDHNGAIDADRRFQLAVKAFAHTAAYDGTIANYLSRLDSVKKPGQFPKYLNLSYHKSQDLRYGENPHQQAALYIEADYHGVAVTNSQQLQGKALSYNNIADTDAAFQCVKSFATPACVIVKHANPCGVATAHTAYEAYNKAYACDSTSAFGGIIAFNIALDAQTAQKMIEQQFVEVIIAPAFSGEAVNILASKKNIRLLQSKDITGTKTTDMELKKIEGGLLIQDKDELIIRSQDLQIVSQVKPTTAMLEDLLFAWKVVKYVKSNAIVYAKNGQTIGIGAGQMSRVFSSKIAIDKATEAQLEIKNTVMASDAFFPFRDGVDAAAKAGVGAIIQPGGSMRDAEIIKAADEHGIAMVFTGVRHFRH
ncbi:MAG: bifunctional phosphoribosylaminoimidazolecarboxamide formyltransferase/IMP cyclohydrolase [Francisellaceae bacterium]